MYNNISIIGAGTWGIAIANHLSPKASVELTNYREEFLDRLKKTRKHPRISDSTISKKISLNYNLEPKGDLLIIAVPVQYNRTVLSKMTISSSVPILI